MHPHRSNAQRYAFAARDAHNRVYGGCAAEAAVSEASGPRVSGCIRAPRYFHPNPVVARGCSGAMTVGILTVHSYYERGHQSGRGNCGEGNEICGAVGKASFQSHAQTPVVASGLSWDLARHTHTV